MDYPYKRVSQFRVGTVGGVRRNADNDAQKEEQPLRSNGKRGAVGFEPAGKLFELGKPVAEPPMPLHDAAISVFPVAVVVVSERSSTRCHKSGFYRRYSKFKRSSRFGNLNSTFGVEFPLRGKCSKNSFGKMILDTWYLGLP